MKNVSAGQSFSQLTDYEEHDLFHLLKTADSIKVTSVIPIKEELSPLELAVYNFLLNLNKDYQSNQSEFNLQFLSSHLNISYSPDDLVEAFRNLDKKYYTECAFDDSKSLVWVKLL